MRKLLLPVAFFLFLHCLYGTEPFVFTDIGLEDGLSHSRIYALLQDSRGFMWIGTSNGLNRYDGRKFRYYKNDPSDGNTLPDNYVTSLLEDSDGLIWIGTDGGGAASLDPRTGRFTRYAASSSDPGRRLSDNYIWSLLEDREGRIWFASTYGGISILDREKGTMSYLKKGPGDGELSYNNVWPMIEDGNGDIWIGTDGGGICRYVSSTGRIVRYVHDPDDGRTISSDFIFSLYIDREGVLWAGTSGGGLNRFDRNTGAFRSFRNDPDDSSTLSNDSVRAVFEDSRGRFWVGTTDGLNLMDRDSRTFTRIFHIPGDSRSLSHSRIHAIMEDRGGLIWFGTRDGISLYREPVFSQRLLSGEGTDFARRNDIRSILPDEGDGLFIGTYQGLFKLEEGFQEVILDDQIVYSLYRSPGGILYCGTDEGLFRVAAERGGGWYKEKLLSAVVTRVCGDDRNNVWASSEDGGLAFVPGDGGEIRRFTDEDPTPVRLYSSGITSMLVRENGNLLIASRDEPLLEMDRDNLTLSEPRESWLNGIRAAYMTRTGKRYVFALDQKGLLAVDSISGESEVFREKDGLPSDIVRAVVPGEGRDLWITTLRGLARLDGMSGRIYSFGRQDGLPGLIFNPGAASADSRGVLYFGSTEGLALFSGKKPAANEYIPELAVEISEGLSMDVDLYREGEPVILEADNKMLVVKLSAFDFSRSEGIRYAYRFGGEGKWIETGNQGEIVFSHIAAGKYTLQVRSSNSDGVWMENPRTIQLIVRPSFPLRWYMLLTYGVLFLLLVLAVMKMRSSFHLRTIRAQEELVLSRTAELEEAKDRLEQEIRRKSMYFINLAHETKTPLTFIRNYIDRYIARAGEDRDLKIIRENVDKLVRDMVNYLDTEKMKQDQSLYDHNQRCNIAELLRSKEAVIHEAAEARGLAFSCSIETENAVQGDPLAVDRVVNNLLDNTLKYNSEKGGIEILLRSEEGHVILEVSDRGPGISESRRERIFDPFYQSGYRKEYIQGIGMGLSIVKMILDGMGAGLFLEPGEKEGTRFRVLFPVGTEPGQEEGAVPLAQPFRSAPAPLPSDVLLSGNHRTLVLVDDDRDMLQLLSETLSDRFNLVFSDSAEDILDRMPSLQCPDLIISDVMLGGIDGHELLRRLQDGPWRSVPFMFLSARGGSGEFLRGIDEGAVDFISKPFSAEELIGRIEARISGQRKRRELFLSENPAREPGDYTVRLERLVSLKGLSPREGEIFRLMAKGNFNKEIAAELGISVRTVEKHIYNLFRKTGVQSRLELINLLH